MIALPIIILAYLIGSIPFGMLLTRMAGLGDIRQIGSGNIGATNVLRTGHKGLAFLTLLMDAVKGMAAVLLAMEVAPYTAPFAAVAAVLGHNFPVWLRFKGGKGVATSLGALIILNLPASIMMIMTWLLVFMVYRISSLAALVTALIAPFFAYIVDDNAMLWTTLALSALLIVRHIPNIKRLIAGEEERPEMANMKKHPLDD